MDMYEIVREHPLLGILRNVPLEQTIDYAEAAVRGGVDFFEVALNSPNAYEQIAMLREYFGDRCMVGAGTAITVERVRKAQEAGAQFFLTPGTPIEVYQYCAEHDLGLIPGVLTPTDVAIALSYGFHMLKLFPAGDMPMTYVKDLKGPFDNVHFMAIGGVNPDNITEFIKAGFMSAGLASSLMPKAAVAAGDWDACTAYAKVLCAKVRGEAI